MMSMINGMTLPYVIPPSGIQHLHMPRMPQTALDMGVRMGVVDMDATLSDQWHSPHFIKPNLMYPRNSYLAHQETMQIQQVSSSIQNTRSPVLWWFCVSLFMLTSRVMRLM
jgi:hypothetical protein